MPNPLTKLYEDKQQQQMKLDRDFKGRRVINATDSKNLADYVTRAEVLAKFPLWKGHV